MSRLTQRTGAVHENCRTAPGENWRRYFRGSGSLEVLPASWRLATADTTPIEYSDAQLDDYQALSRRQFLWTPPVAMRVRARFSHDREQLRGTAGFGFWNDPFLMTGWRLPALPRAIWFFFASEPSDMVLDLDVAGHGWKAMTLDALNGSFVASLPLLPLAAILMNIRPIRRAVWPTLQRTVRAAETLLDVNMTGWHTYEIMWDKGSRFSVDGHTVFEHTPAPAGPLGFVIWLDNQYAIVTPWGRLGYGLLATSGRQWLEVDEINIEYHGT